ncbi:hypothetical protein [Helicobacter trogontum]|uniref:Outer membrane beta-barrel protein n=1 Tax=Helicobacter trogontum TaxID=50960 RepID=A0A4U8TBI6_9HELI|nr:hypothetical protein [Helicobacter trogontum]MDY5184376.1 hypothetical protein [Helicobacter trogontum]TLD97034.1 hypothetical protein LS80_007480 [Helicobacter trogontum]
MKKTCKSIWCMGALLCFVNMGIAKDGFSIGGVVAIDNKSIGGGFEVGFPLLQKGLSIRNYISILTYAAENVSPRLLLQEKITFGGPRDSGVARLYGFVSGSFGLIMQGQKDMFRSPFAWEGFVGGGADIYAGEHASVFVEAGGGLSGDTLGVMQGFGRIQVGFRGFF